MALLPDYMMQGEQFGGPGGQPSLLDGLPPWLRDTISGIQGSMPPNGIATKAYGQFPPSAGPPQQQQPPMPQGAPMPQPSPFAAQASAPPQAPQMPPGGLPARTPFGQRPRVDGMGDRLYEALGGFLGNDGLIGGGAAAIKTLATGEVTNPYALQKRQQMETYSSLIRDFNLSPAQAQMAMQNPEVMKAFIPTIAPKYESQKHGPLYGRFNAATGRFDAQGAAPEFQKLSPGETGGYVTPPMGGQPGGYAEVASGGPEKPPEHYTWNDPSNPAKGATRIPGTEPPMSSEEAGKLAMVQSSKAGVAQARDYFLGPDFKDGLNAPFSAAAQRLNIGDTSRHRRSVEMGSEAALRMATGANAPPSEVDRYANFYMPSVYDDVKTRQQKLDALQRFMTYAEANMKAGRLVGIKDLPSPEKFMQGGSASGPVKDQSRVQNPSWPPPPPGFMMGGQ